jgi:glycosyltransferase involved in cell wall biosynthesis
VSVNREVYMGQRQQRNRIPKVSVIIPTYNRADFIGEAIQSILDQTFQDFEIIVVDDGSTDNTHEIIEKFNEPRIKYVFQENRGVCEARNTGIKNSRGEYITFLDSDDVLYEKAFEKGVHALENHPEVGISHGQVKLMDKSGNLYETIKKYKGSYIQKGIEEIRQLFTRGYYVNINTLMVRRVLLQKNGPFDTSFCHGSEDFDLVVRLCKKTYVAHIAEPLAKYRIYYESMENIRDCEERVISNTRIFESMFKDKKYGPLLAPERSRTYFHQYYAVARDAYGLREMKIARKYLLKALKTYPRGCLRWLGLPWIYLYLKTFAPEYYLNLSSKVVIFWRSIIGKFPYGKYIGERPTDNESG